MSQFKLIETSIVSDVYERKTSTNKTLNLMSKMCGQSSPLIQQLSRGRESPYAKALAFHWLRATDEGVVSSTHSA